MGWALRDVELLTRASNHDAKRWMDGNRTEQGFPVGLRDGTDAKLHNSWGPISTVVMDDHSVACNTLF